MGVKKELEKNNFFVETYSSKIIAALKFKKVLLEKKSSFQKIKVLDSDFLGKILVLDEIIQTTEKDEFIYHENLVHPAMFAHENPKKVLIIGGGDGGCLREALKHGPEKAVMVELDKEVVEVSKKYLPELSDGAFDDERVELVFGDGKKYIEKTEEKFDVVILDLTDPKGPSKFLYTKEFYESVKEKLSKGGTVALHCSTPFNYPETFATIVKTLRFVFPFVCSYDAFVFSYTIDLWFSLCSARKIFLRSKKKIEGLRYFSKEFFDGLNFVPLYARELVESKGRVATVDEPIEWETNDMVD